MTKITKEEVLQKIKDLQVICTFQEYVENLGKVETWKEFLNNNEYIGVNFKGDKCMVVSWDQIRGYIVSTIGIWGDFKTSEEYYELYRENFHVFTSGNELLEWMKD